jgi:hypothetical protein
VVARALRILLGARHDLRTLRPTTFDLINSFWAGERDPA